MEIRLKRQPVVLNQIMDALSLMVAESQALCHRIGYLGTDLLVTVMNTRNFLAFWHSPFTDVMKETGKPQNGTGRGHIHRRQEVLVYVPCGTVPFPVSLEKFREGDGQKTRFSHHFKGTGRILCRQDS